MQCVVSVYIYSADYKPSILELSERT